jgi:hypothetical protein
MTRTEMRDLFGRNQSGNRIGAALALLQKSARAMMVPRETQGRSAEVWYACSTREAPNVVHLPDR